VICINYVVGTGIFSLPYGFYSSGIVLATICLVISGIFSLLCAWWVLEVLARTEGITTSVYDLKNNTSFSEEHHPTNEVTFRKFDFTRMFDTYYGLKGKIFCQAIMGFYCYGVLWAFTAVFASSVSSLFFQFIFNETCDIYQPPVSMSCHLTYYLCILLFALIVIPLACMDVAEQAYIQVALASYRAIAFIIMITTVIVASFHADPNGQVSNHQGPPYIAFASPIEWGGFSAIFSSSVVALTFHYCIPDLIVTTRDKVAFKKVITCAIFTIIALYFSFGVVCGLFFGKNTQPLVTLNWSTYTGQAGGWGPTDHRPWWAAMIQLLVMVFPIFDMLSVFPLVAITLGNNILESTPRVFKEAFAGRRGKIMCRFVAAVPPIILGALLGNLSSIFKFTALFAFFLEFVFPCFLQLASTKECRKWWGAGSEKTPYSGHFSRFIYVYITLVFAVVAFTFAFVAVVAPHFIEKIFGAAG